MTGIEKAFEEAWLKSALADVLLFECWEPLRGESSLAFCTFRDIGPERNIRKVILTTMLVMAAIFMALMYDGSRHQIYR